MQTQPWYKAPILIALFLLMELASPVHDAFSADQNNPLFSGRFLWKISLPLVSPPNRPADPCYSMKDPTIVRVADRWHLFCTIRSVTRTHQIEYLSFTDWPQADSSPRHVLQIVNGYFCAPQVFFFTPQNKWYLVYQKDEPSRTPRLQPAFSTSSDLSQPDSWSAPELLFQKPPTNVKMWIDFWIICDEKNAHLFFTSLDGKMWRSDAPLASFPHGWSEPAVVLEGDIFEAGHIYKLKGMDRYLALIEAQADGRRYYKAYVADRLDAEWQSLAATREQPFASLANVRDSESHWADSISHGELLRAGFDEKMEVDPHPLRFLFQGVTDARMTRKKYGEIPWQLGILEEVR